MYVFSVSTFAYRSEKGELRQMQPGIARMRCARMDVKPINRRRRRVERVHAPRFEAERDFTWTRQAWRSRAGAMSWAKKTTRRVMNRQRCDARSCSSSFRPRGDRFSACRLSENVMHILCPLHTALRGSSRVGAALESD